MLFMWIMVFLYVKKYKKTYYNIKVNINIINRGGKNICYKIQFMH